MIKFALVVGGALAVLVVPAVAAAPGWLSCEDAAGWEGARDFNAAKVAQETEVRKEGEAALRVSYRAGAEKWLCGGIQRRFDPPLDLSGAGGFAVWVYNPDPAAKRIFSFYQAGGEQYWVRHSREPRWLSYGANDECLLPAGPGWHEVTFHFDDIHTADRAASAPDRESLRAIERLVIAIQERGKEERDTWFALDGVRLLPPVAAPQPGHGTTGLRDHGTTGPRTAAVTRHLEEARGLRRKGDVAGALAILDEALAPNPWYRAAQEETLALYAGMAPEGKEKLKGRCRERYQEAVRQDLPLAQGWARLHQRLVDAWSRERPIEGFRFGTQTFGIRYQFTEKTKLVETAEAVRDLGSDTLKYMLATDTYGLPKGDFKSLVDLATREPSHRAVLGMPFRHFLIWVYPLGVKEWWRDGTGTPEVREAEYRQIYDLACHLLKTYSGTGKRFYLGNWEGDWHLTGIPSKEPSEARIAGMREWFRIRQQAVDDAKRDTPHRGVGIYHYMEVNLVPEAMRGAPRLTNAVLPYTNVDYVSYSSYTTTAAQLCKSGQMARELPRALDFIERHLPPKDLPGKRVWIGEFGFPVNHGLTPELQAQYTVDVARVALKWGCPFILYWEIYCNEYDKEKEQHNGFWLIDDKGERQPIYGRMQRFLERAGAWEKERGAAGLAAGRYVPEALKWLE